MQEMVSDGGLAGSLFKDRAASQVDDAKWCPCLVHDFLVVLLQLHSTWARRRAGVSVV